MELSGPNVRAPEFPDLPWLNSLRPINLANLRGSIVLIQFFDYTCTNCLRTLPYLRAWHQRYTQHGLHVIGVHTPEFSFAHDHGNVKASLGRLGISWPVVLDNDQKVWAAYANSSWPAIYLLDAEGQIRYKHAREGSYRQIEQNIQELLKIHQPGAQFPDPVSHLREQDAPGSICYPTTPGLHIDAIGNDQVPVSTPALFVNPKETQDGKFYIEGWWQRSKDGFCMVGDQGSIFLKYHAASVHGIFATASDPVERALGIQDVVLLSLHQDGGSIDKILFSEDLFELDGEACIRISDARNYTLLRNPDVQAHELLIHVKGSGLFFYGFSFGSCVDPVASSNRNS